MSATTCDLNTTAAAIRNEFPILNRHDSSGRPLIYLDTGQDLTAHLNRVEPAGGSVVEAKTSMGEAGYYATFRDSEGNLLALYSYK